MVAARVAWPEYLRFHAYVCQPDRSFRQVKYVAFYAEGKIQALIPAILQSEPEPVVFQRGLYKGELGELVQRMLDEGVRQEGNHHKVIFLSSPDDQRTIKLESPIPNDLPSAYTQGQRYASLASLQKKKLTSELDTDEA